MAGEIDPSGPQDEPGDLDQEQARLAYTIIASLLEHTRVVSDLIALMAQDALDGRHHQSAHADTGLDCLP